MKSRCSRLGSKELRPCLFHFEQSPVFEGFTEGIYSKGFLSVEVGSVVHREVLAYLRREAKERAYTLGIGIEDILPAHYGGLDEALPNERHHFEYPHRLRAEEVAQQVIAGAEANTGNLATVSSSPTPRGRPSGESQSSPLSD